MSAQRGSGFMRAPSAAARAWVPLVADAGHHQAELALGGGRGIGFADDVAVEHHEDAVGERADFVELDRDEEDRLPRVAHLDDLVVDELDGADVDAARRLADDQHFGIALHLAGEDDLLLVAAGEVGGLELVVGAGGCRTS